MAMCLTPRMSALMRMMVSMDPGRRIEKVRREIIPLLAATWKGAPAEAQAILGTRIRRTPASCGTRRATLTKTSRLGP